MDRNNKGQFVRGKNLGNQNAFGQKHTEKWKRDISNARKGIKPYQMTEEIKKKISASLMGKVSYIMTDKVRKKISESHRGVKLSPAHVKAMSDCRIGKPNLKLRKLVHKIDESKLWRNRIEYRLWREAVFARDNWTCQKCLTRGNELHPHHIFNFHNHQELRFAIDNGITFCINCHKKFHHIFGTKNNNLKQIKKYEGNNF